MASIERAEPLGERRDHGSRRIVIAGGGVAALETLLALRTLVGTSAEITLISKSHDFHYRPMTVTEPFDLGEARRFSLSSMLAHRGGGKIIWGGLTEVDPDARIAITDTGRQVEYDVLVVATGAVATDPLPGALTFGGDANVEALRAMLAELTAGIAKSVAFVVPAPSMWCFPLYELAMMCAGHLRNEAADARVTFVTPEEEPLELFGPDAARAVRPLLEGRGIELACSSLAAAVDGRALLLVGGGRIHADRFVTMPVLRGPELPGLPSDHDGFIPVDSFGRVSGLEDVYAAGDVCSFPLKQGGLATQQADAVAESIAARLGAPISPAPFAPVLRGLLLTGGAPLYLRCEPQRMQRSTTIASEASTRAISDATTFEAGGRPLWWPPSKVAGRYLAPYLATARPEPLESELLVDRAAVRRPSNEQSEHAAAELALLLADCDARWGDYESALSSLDSAQALAGSLPPEYTAKRRQWRDAGHLHA